MELSPKGITSLLNSITDAALQPQADPTSRRARLLEAQTIFESLDQVSIVHVNVMLKVYYACADIGGWDFAWRLFERLGPRTKSKTEDEEDLGPLGDLIPDTVTFTMMIKFCAKAKTEAATKIGLQLWDDIGKLNAQTVTTKKIRLDTQLLNSMLMIYTHSPNDNVARKGLDFIRHSFGLPLRPEEKVKELKKRMSVRTLTLLIQYATRIQCPDMGLAWFNIIKTKGLKDKYEKLDEGVYNCLSTMMIEAGQFSKLHQVLEISPRVPFGIKLRVYATALHTNAPESQKWWERANEILEKRAASLFKFHDILNYVECGILTGNFRHVASIALERQEDVIKWTKGRFEKVLKRTLENQLAFIDYQELGLDVKLLRWIQIAATQMSLAQNHKNPLPTQPLKALLLQVQETLGIWETIESKHKYAKYALRPILRTKVRNH